MNTKELVLKHVRSIAPKCDSTIISVTDEKRAQNMGLDRWLLRGNGLILKIDSMNNDDDFSWGCAALFLGIETDSAASQAAEIKRLRDALESISNVKQTHKFDLLGLENAKSIALNALKPQESEVQNG